MKAAAESLSLIGSVLEERYSIVREIGRGGMGVVYEAEHTELGKRVAVKVILDKYADDDEAVIRFKREALAASRIGNPHIIDVSHIGTAPDGRPFVVMELLEGEPLASLLKRTGPMAAWRAIHIMRQVLRATGAAHAKGIVHRDLKPDNIFIVNRDDQPDFVKLLDFGISKFLETGEHSLKTQLTTTGAVMGTPLYMAPEQAMGSPVAPSVDIYACGVILFEMLAGRPPFNDDNYNVLVAKLLTASPPRLDELRSGLARPLVVAVHRALEKEPSARFASAESFLLAIPSDQSGAELEVSSTLASGANAATPAAGGTTATPATGANAATPATAAPTMERRRPARWIVVGIVLLVVGIVGIVEIAIYTRTHASTEPPPTPPPLPAPTPAPDPAPLPTTTPPPTAPTPAATGTLEVKTIPPHAAVRIDGRDAGATPLEADIPPGRHRLRVGLAGYTGIDADQDVRAGERTSATFELVAKPAVVKHKPAPHLAAPANPSADPPATVAPPPLPPTGGGPSEKPNPY